MTTSEQLQAWLSAAEGPRIKLKASPLDPGIAGEPPDRGANPGPGPNSRRQGVPRRRGKSGLMRPAGQIARELVPSCKMRAIAGYSPLYKIMLPKHLRVCSLHASNCTGMS